VSTLRLALTKNFLTKRSKLQPEIAIVLGSGFSDTADWLAPETILDYASIPNFVPSTVGGHSGKLVFGHAPGGKPLLVFFGRAHYYEGLTMREAAYPAYVSHALGASIFIVTNAAGGLNPDFAPGELMLIRDHINLMGDNPLRGPQFPKDATRFPPMRDAYDLDLFARALDVARRHGIKLHQGVYAAMNGPAYETDAELRMLYSLGADAVGMSTVPEVMAARQVGLRVLGLSVISNDVFPRRRQQPAEVSHEEVLHVVAQSVPHVRAILKDIVEETAV
jgi:purine-nucleoside phosphorylase